jgi:hypothetical protein
MPLNEAMLIQPCDGEGLAEETEERSILDSSTCNSPRMATESHG